MAAGKLIKIFHFIKLLRIEPVAFLTFFIGVIKKIPQDQLTQDKICLQRYELPEDYCHNLPTMTDAEDTVYKMKSTILADVTQFNLYVNAMTTIPILIISLLIGPFIDNYKPAKKILLVFSVAITLLECSILALNSYFFSANYYFLLANQAVTASCGGPLVSLSTMWAYLAVVTPAHLRPVRMASIEICLMAATPIATFAGGNLLVLQPLFVGHELRNYITIFGICCCCAILALLVVIFLLDEDHDVSLFALYFPAESKSSSSEKKHENIQMHSKVDQIDDDKTTSATQMHPLRMLFNMANVKNMYHTFTKPRPHHIRLQIFLMVFATMAILVAYIGPTVFLYQYVQKLFSWNSSQYSNYSAATSAINIVTSLLFAPVLMNVFKLADLTYALISVHVILIQNIIFMSSKSMTTFFVAMPFYTLNSLGMVGIRSYLTKIIEPNELGRVFSLMSVIDSCIPFLCSLLFTSLFRLTIDSSMPNISFSAICASLVAGIVCMFVTSCQSRKTLRMIEEDKNNSVNNEIVL